MTDIVQRLRHADEYEPLLGHDAWKAADTIEALQSRIRALEEALKPLGDIADLIDGETEGVADEDEVQLLLHDYLLDRFTVYLFRRARDVLKGDPK